MMGVLTNLFRRKQKIEKREKLFEDVFFSPGYAYYEHEDDSIKGEMYQVFTLYSSLYDENSDEEKNISELRNKLNLLVTGIIYPDNEDYKDLEKRK